MTLIIILILISILVYIFIPFKTNVYKLKKVLTKSECEEIISMVEKNEFLTTPDPVDKEPVYQIEVLEPNKTVNHPELYFKCMELYKKRLPKQEGALDFIFLKRYAPGERTNIPIHVDLSKSTINILLSDPKDYEGGEFYIFENPSDPRMEPVKEAETIEAKNSLLKNMKDLPIVYMQRGDMITYKGRVYEHGVLPITSGVRYVLTYFFDHV